MVIAQLIASGIFLGGIYALVSIGLALIFGVLRVVNFAHGEFLMLAMYLAFWLFQGYQADPYLTIFLALPAFFALGALAYWLVLRFTIGAPHVVQIFATVGISVALQNLALMLWTANFRTIRPVYADTVFRLGPVSTNLPQILAFAVAMLAAAALFAFLRWTYPGKAIRATAQDRATAILMGIDVRNVYLLTVGIGTALVGLAGALLMPMFPVYPTYGVQLALVAYVVVVLGGLGSMSGALLGGLLVGVVESFSSYYVGVKWREVIYFLVFLAVLVLRPAGLFGQRGAEEVSE